MWLFVWPISAVLFAVSLFKGLTYGQCLWHEICVTILSTRFLCSCFPLKIYLAIYYHKNKGKGVKLKVKQYNYRPGQAPRVTGGWGSQISRQSAHEGGKVVSNTRRLPLPPRKYSWYSFLLGDESTPGPQCDRKDYVNEKFQWHHRESNPRPSGL